MICLDIEQTRFHSRGTAEPPQKTGQPQHEFAFQAHAAAVLTPGLRNECIALPRSVKTRGSSRLTGIMLKSESRNGAAA